MRKVTTVGTLIEHDGKILILLRGNKEESSPGTWGLAAGRLEEGEEPAEAALREVEEETGHQARKEDLEEAGTHTWQSPGMDVTFHAYRLPVKERIKVKLDPAEHDAYAWKTPDEILQLDNPIPGLRELINAVYHTSRRARTKA
ncbi:MAG: NUDIX domain-containing protein [Candidatus Woesearchaeota archaeon]